MKLNRKIKAIKFRAGFGGGGTCMYEARNDCFKIINYGKFNLV